MRAKFYLFILLCFSLRVYSQAGKIDSLKNELRIAKADTNRVNALNELAFKLARIGQLDSGMYYSDLAKKLAEKLDFKKGLAVAYNDMAIISSDRGDYKEGIKYLELWLWINKALG